MSNSDLPTNTNPYAQPIQTIDRPTVGRFYLASRGRRLLASIIDGLLITVPATFVKESPSVGASVGVGIYILIILVMQCVFLTTSGQTLAKKMFGIRIVKMETGENGGFVTNVLLRGVVNALLSIIPFYELIDALFIFFEDKRCLHDRIAGTIVIYV